VFPGQYHDQETGLSYNLMRDYDPKTGRYLEADPLGIAAGASLYGYAIQNPVMYYDPDGQYAIGILLPGLALLGALIAGEMAWLNYLQMSGDLGGTDAFPIPGTTTRDCETCATKFPSYITCSRLSGYVYNSTRDALSAFGGRGNALHNPSPAYGGPCAGTPGEGMHWNVRNGGMRVGSIVSCTCCMDSNAGPSLKTKYKAVF